MVRITDVLISPIVTEKTVGATGKYAFRVHVDADKASIAKAIKLFYKDVKIAKINVINLKGKTRMVGRGRPVNKRAPLRKAIITLEKGQTINFNDFK
jgi:large subunit ribosomal protein L23